MAGENNENFLGRPIDRGESSNRNNSRNAFKRIFFNSCRCRGHHSNENVPSNTNFASTSDESQYGETPPNMISITKVMPRSSTMTVKSYDAKSKKKGCYKRMKQCCNYCRSSQDDNSDLKHKKKNRIISINSNQNAHFLSNVTKTAKYTIFTFLPLFLFDQFRKLTNLFFLIMAIFQQIPGVSPTGRYITLFPLLFILTVSAIKEIIEDTKRHRADRETNKRNVEKLSGQEWRIVNWKNIEVGDFVRIKDKECFPADLLLLASKNSDGICFVETSNLDGESNLKVRKAIPETMHLINTIELSNWRGIIECDPPNRRIYNFFGLLNRPHEETVTFGSNQLLQRGAALNGTEWIHGIVVYTGHETKLMKNIAQAPLKRSSIERLLNKQFISLLTLFLIVSLTSGGMYLSWLYKNVESHSYLGIEEHAMGIKQISYNILTYLLLYNNLIPISLTVTMEMVYFFQARFINSDAEMFHKETETFAMVRSSNLNGELGLVQYILTDKTGTLTCNVMKFRQCSIAGIIYDIEDDMSQSELIRNLLDGHPTVSVMEEFMLLIALCHSVVSETMDDGTIVYHATNPDDQAIIESAKNMGYEFLTRGTDYVDIMRFGHLERYTLLQTIEFNSDRKRMSVFVRMPDGNIKLFCKGADSVILARLSTDDERDYYSLTREHLNILASEGLRTLCCAVTDISEEQFTNWNELYRQAMTLFENREIEMEQLEDQIERNLILLGVTAIEDKLQDGVPETITYILSAGIRIWMLTGDKQETAINIAYSCSLINKTMRVIILKETSLRGAFNALHSKQLQRRPLKNSALVIDGKTLDFVLSEDLYNDFKAICLKCRVVVCCRLSPMQKGKITDLVNSIGACTLAIGDGANDVTMIRRARVGVGISGVEGLQAAAASDFSIAQFRYLKRLLFVHGTWNHHRMTKMILYSFYKNILLCIMLMWYCFYNGWSAQVLFDRWIIAAWNLVFTSWPPLAIGICDKVCSEKTLLKYPGVYGSSDNSKCANLLIFWIWVIIAIVHSMILFWLPLAFFGDDGVIWKSGKNMELNIFGNTIYTAAVFVVCLKAGLILNSWNFITHISIWGSILAWFVALIIYSYFWPFIPAGPDFSYSHYRIFSSLKVWLVVIIVVIVTLLPDVYIKILTNTFLPSLTMTAEMQYKISSNRNRT